MQYEDVTTKFDGGIALSTKSALPNAARFTRNLAIYEDTDSVTLTPKPVLDTTTTGLVRWIVDANPYQDARYAYDDAGKIYKILSNSWSVDATAIVGAPQGQGMAVLANTLYYATATTLGQKPFLLQGTGIYDDNFIQTQGLDIDTNIYNPAIGFTYTPPVAISETAVNKYAFTPRNDPLRSAQFFVVAKGTGNWTVTIHDDQENTIAAQTITNANLTNGVMNNWAFQAAPNAQVWWNIGSLYHFHVTSTVADGALTTGTVNDLSNARLTGYFSILTYDANYHPLIQHTNGTNGTLIIGNGNYLAQYDPFDGTYNPNQIKLEPGYFVRTMSKINEFVAAWCWRSKASGDSNVDDYEYGKVFFWDGIQPYYNFSRDLTQGMPNAAINFKNRIFGVFGSNGDLALAPDESSPFRQLQPAPKLTIGSRIEVMPNAIGVWQRRVLFGYSNTTDTNAGAYNDTQKGVHAAGDTYTPPLGMEQGVYEFGNQSDRAISYTSVSTEVLNFAFQPSTVIANPATFLIGAIEPFGKDCYVSYQDGTSYYVDRITKGNAPAAYGSWESLITGEVITRLKQLADQPQKTKRGLRVVVTCQSLPTGATVTTKYRINRSTPWIFGASAPAGSVSATVLLGTLGGLNYREIEYGFDMTASSTGYPVVTSVGIFLETLDGETTEGQL